MSVIATTLNGINVLQQGADFSRVVAAGVDVIHFDISSGKALPPGPFGEFMIANIASWTNLCIDVHLLDDASSVRIENSVACGADILTIPLEIISKSVRQLVSDLGALLCAEVKISRASITQLPSRMDLVYLDLDEGAKSSSSFPSTFENSYLDAIHAMRRGAPDVAVAGRLPTLTISPFIIKLLQSLDLVTLDLFETDNPTAVIEEVRHYMSPDLHPTLHRALPHGLNIKRDQRRLVSIFETLEAKMPPKTSKFM